MASSCAPVGQIAVGQKVQVSADAYPNKTFLGQVSSLNSSDALQAAPVAQQMASPATKINALIAEASKDFADYQRLTAAGKLSEAGQKLDSLKAILDQLKARGN